MNNGINNNKIFTKKPLTYSKFGHEEYKVEGLNQNYGISAGGLSFGTHYDSEIDYSEYEQTAGFFTKYETKHFALTSSYERTIGSAYGNYIDNIYVAPELKFNDTVSIKEVLSANMTYRRKKAELILSVSPFSKKLDGRLNFEAGINHTYDESNQLIRSRIKFNTKFKL